MHICVIPWSRCVATGKHRYYTANDKMTQHWHTYQHSQNTLQPFLHSATKFGVALINPFPARVYAVFYIPVCRDEF